MQPYNLAVYYKAHLLAPRHTVTVIQHHVLCAAQCTQTEENQVRYKRAAGQTSRDMSCVFTPPGGSTGHSTTHDHSTAVFFKISSAVDISVRCVVIDKCAVLWPQEA